MLDAIMREVTGSFSAVPWHVSAIRLTAAMLLSAVIGFEREHQKKPAGLRTHMLVAIAACLFVLVGLELTELEFGDTGTISSDPLRLIDAVTAGVAFLAAGIIFTSGGKVQNITTGASLWLAGAIGRRIGAGRIPLALMATVIVVVVVGVVRTLKPDWKANDG